MAQLAFYKNPGTTDQGFYLKMKTEVLEIMNTMNPLLKGYRGTFEFTVDIYSPWVRYCREPFERLDEQELQAQILYLRTKQFEIAINILNERFTPRHGVAG